MKIAYSKPDGGVAIVTPAPFARLVSQVTFNRKAVTIDPPQPFDRFVRQFKTADLSPVWAESEADFFGRIAAKDVPAGAFWKLIDDSEVPPRETREAYSLGPDGVYLNSARVGEVAKLRIQRVEDATPITHRALREFFVGFGEVNPAFKETVLYKKAKAADDAIRAERAKL